MDVKIIVEYLNQLIKTVSDEKSYPDFRFSLLNASDVLKNENVHSNILAMFLRGPQNEFSDCFCKILSEQFGDNFKNIKIKEVTREKYIKSDKYGEGRVDLEIRFDNGDILIIENKIYAGDHEDQLNKYIDYYENGNFSVNVYYCYLSLFAGNDPSSFSLSPEIKNSIKDRYRPLSYEKDIINCINSVLNSGDEDVLFHAACQQYKNGLEELMMTKAHYEIVNKWYKSYIILGKTNQEQLMKSVDTLYRVGKLLDFFSELMKTLKNKMMEKELGFLVNNLFFIRNQNKRFSINEFNVFQDYIFKNCDHKIAFGIVCLVDKNEEEHASGIGIEYELAYDSRLCIGVMRGGNPNTEELKGIPQIPGLKASKNNDWWGENTTEHINIYKELDYEKFATMFVNQVSAILDIYKKHNN